MDFGVLDVVRESGDLCSALLPTLLLITLVLIFPFSSIALSQSLATTQLASQLYSLFSHHLLLLTGAPASPLAALFYTQLSQTLLSQTLCFPLTITLCMLSKAAIFYLLTCRDRGKEASFVQFLDVAPHAWLRMAATFAWGCIWAALITAAVVFLDVAATMGLRLLSESFAESDGLDSLALVALETGSMLAYALLLAPMLVILNLSTAVAGLEETKWGPLALLRALALLRHRRLQPALILFLISSIAAAGIEGTFQYRVLGRATLPTPPPASSLLEAPFLIFAHSFLLLFDTVLTFVFYQSCRNAAEFLCVRKLKSEEDDDEDHFSIVIHVVERQCRKVFTSSQAIL